MNRGGDASRVREVSNQRSIEATSPRARPHSPDRGQAVTAAVVDTVAGTMASPITRYLPMTTPRRMSRSARRLRGIVPLLAAVVALGLYAGAGVTSADHGGRPIGSVLACDRPGVSPPRCTSVGNNLR